MFRKWFGKKQQPQIQRPTLFRKLAVESLEKREVLAGSVTIAFSGGNLYLTGDASANSVNIDVNGPNSVQITGNATTIVNNTAGSFLVTGGVYATLNGGGDTVNVLGAGSLTGDLIINLGAGNGTVSKVVNSALSIRDFFVTTTTGNDSVAINGISARNINVNTGTGDTAISFDNTTTTGYANLINGAGAGGAQSASVATASSIGTGLLISLGNGASGYTTVLNASSVGGTTNIINGSGTGAASITLTNVSSGSSVFLTNGNNASNAITVGGINTFGAGSNLRNGTATTTNSIGVDGVTAASPASHTFANGAAGTSNTLTLGGAAANSLTGPVNVSNTSAATGSNFITAARGTFGSSLTVNNYAGGVTNGVTFGSAGAASVTGILTVSNGASTGSNVITLNNLTTSGSSATLSNAANTGGGNQVFIGTTTAVSLAGTVNVLNSTSSGVSQAFIDNYTGSGNLSVSNGITVGATTVSIDGPSTVGGGLTITNQSALSHAVTLNGLAVTTAASIYNNGAGTNTVNIGTTAAVSTGAGLTYIDGTGDATVTLAQLAVGGVLNYFDNGGIDLLTLGSAAGAGLTVGGVTNINTSAGADVVNIGTTAATFGGKLNVNMGADDDHLIIGAAAVGLATNNFLFDGGAGTGDYWTISATAIPGINPLDPVTASKIYNFEGFPNPNTPTA